MRDEDGAESTDRWEGGLRILARLIALRIQAAALKVHPDCNSPDGGRHETTDETNDAAATKTDSEPGLE